MSRNFVFAVWVASVFAVLAPDVSVAGDASVSVAQGVGSASCITERYDKVPRSVTVITRAQIQQQTALTRDMNQILYRLVPGFAFSARNTRFSRSALRGKQSSVLVDGVPLSINPRSIEPATIERIEVIPNPDNRCRS
ncbi:MAG: Plug domain-containing protein [Microcoleus vaginatus WJT46-NPBG5]|jgi:iron complex outermembrane receptor protein|nr:Plug domain-containing protein [Microcoleus vaginatus WJT46-NPBG5]